MHVCLHVCMLGYVMLPHLPRRTDCLLGPPGPLAARLLGPGLLGHPCPAEQAEPFPPLSLMPFSSTPSLLRHSLPSLTPLPFLLCSLPFSLTPSLPSSLLHHSLSFLRPSLTPHLALLLPPCSFSSGFARETLQVGDPRWRSIGRARWSVAAQPPTAHGPLPRCPRRSGRQHALCEPLGRRDVNFVKRRRNRNMFRACTRRAPRS